MSNSPAAFLSAQAHHPADPFRLLVESVVDYAIYMVDPAKRVASWNPGAERIYGYRAEEIIGQPFSTVYTPDDLSSGRPEEIWRLALEAGHFEFECERVRKDKSQFLAVVTVSALKDHFGNHAGFSVVTRDVTEKRRAELALQVNEEGHRRLLDFLPDAVFVNSEGRIAYCNSAFVHMLEAADGGELLGKPVMSIFHPKHHEAIRKRIETIQFHNGTVPLLEEEVVREDGIVVPVEVAATAVTHQGRPAILVVLRDLRQRKGVERLHRAMIDGVKDYAIYMMDPEGTIVTWNEGAARIFGYTAEAAIGSHRSLLFIPEDVAAGIPQAEQQRAVAFGSANEERWRVRKDGSRFWANGVMTAIRDGGGTVCGYVKIVRDLTERQLAATALKESEERYRNLFNAIADPLFVYDRETLAYLAVNDAAVKSYGYSRDEFAGMTIKDVRPVEDVSALLDMLAASGTDLEERGVWRHSKRDGTVMEVEITAHGLEYAGRPACVIQARDVTEKRRAAAEAARANDLLRAVVEGTPDALFVKDRSGKYLLFNAAAARFVGKPVEEVLGRDDTALFDPESARIAMEHDQLVIATNRANTDEERLTAAGATRTYLATKMPFKDSEGNVIGVLGISRDVTDRKRAEDALRQQQALLRIAGRVSRLGGWSLDLATDVVEWSDEICEIHEEPNGHRPSLADGIRYYLPEYRERVARHVQECATEGTPFDFELELITAKGRRIWVRAIGEAVRDDAGRIVSLQGAFQDISESKKAQDEQRRLGERLTTTLEAMTDGFCILDREWRYTYINAEAERMVSGRREELLGCIIWEAFPATLGTAFEREYRRAMAEQVTVEFEEYFTPFKRWFGVRAHPSEQGLVIYIRDVTTSRMAAVALQASEARFRTVVQSSWDVFHLVEPDGRITYESPAVTRVLGYLPEEMVGHNIGEFVHPDDLRDLVASAPDHLATPGKQRTIVLRVRHKDGSWRWVESYEVNLVDHPDVRAVAVNYRDITARKLAEDSLRASEREQRELTAELEGERSRLIAAQAVAKVGSWETDLATLGVLWSDETYRIFEQAKGRFQPTHPRFLELVHPEDRDAVDRAFQGTVHLHTPQKIEHRIVTPGGRIKSVEERWEAVFDGQDRPVRVMGTCQDISERKHAEETLLLRDRAIQQVSQGIAISDPNRPDNPIIYASPGFERMTGYRPEEMIGRNCRMLQGEGTDPKTVRKLREAIANGQSCTVELLNYRKDGTPFWNELSVNPVRDSKGETSYYVGVQNDVTERKLMSAENDRLLTQLQMQIERMPLAYLLSDADFRYTRWNATAERMFGYAQEEVLGRHPYEVIVPVQSQPFVSTIFDKIKAGSMDSHGECENRTKGGKPIVCEWHNTPMFDANGAFAGLMSLAKDVTERKELEIQLRQSQKMEAVGRLAGGVAHDFNNLLTVISGYSELLLAKPDLGSDVQESVSAISDAGDRAAALTRQLLGFSRQTLLQPKVLDLNAVVTETGKLLRRLIGEDILFTTVLDPKISRVKVDPGQLDQVLMNLAVNARDAMPRGGKLTIETGNVLLSDDYAASHVDCKAGHHVLLAMSDTGSGMPPEVLARIFEPFFTTKEVGRGTGLGLAMVFGIIQQSGGCIHVYSEPGRGTTFKIYLPAVAEAPVAKRGSESKPSLKGTETVLLVEDDDGVRALGLISLKAQGYRVLTATDGNDALAVIRAFRGPLDLILTDVVMPSLGGPALIQMVKAECPGVKVLYMSGYTDDAVVRHGLIEADVAFIQKPYTPLGLARKVRQVLDGG